MNPSKISKTITRLKYLAKILKLKIQLLGLKLHTKYPNAYRFRFVALLIPVLLLLSVGAIIFSVQPNAKIMDIKIANVSSGSATIIWITEEKSESVLVLNEGEKLSGLQAILAEKYQDDRDEVGDSVARNTHFVTVNGLKPDTGYFIQIGSSKINFDTEDNLAFSTKPIAENFEVPQPLFGSVRNDSDLLMQDADDAIVLLEPTSETNNEILASLLNSENNWVLNPTNSEELESDGYKISVIYENSVIEQNLETLPLTGSTVTVDTQTASSSTYSASSSSYTIPLVMDSNGKTRYCKTEPAKCANGVADYLADYYEDIKLPYTRVSMVLCCDKTSTSTCTSVGGTLKTVFRGCKNLHLTPTVEQPKVFKNLIKDKDGEFYCQKVPAKVCATGYTPEGCGVSENKYNNECTFKAGGSLCTSTSNCVSGTSCQLKDKNNTVSLFQWCRKSNEPTAVPSKTPVPTLIPADKYPVQVELKDMSIYYCKTYPSLNCPTSYTRSGCGFGLANSDMGDQCLLQSDTKSGCLRPGDCKGGTYCDAVDGATVHNIYLYCAPDNTLSYTKAYKTTDTGESLKCINKNLASCASNQDDIFSLTQNYQGLPERDSVSCQKQDKTVVILNKYCKNQIVPTAKPTLPVSKKTCSGQCGSGTECNDPSNVPPPDYMWSCIQKKCVVEKIKPAGQDTNCFLSCDTGTWQGCQCDEDACRSKCVGDETTHTDVCAGCQQEFTCSCEAPAPTVTEPPDADCGEGVDFNFSRIALYNTTYPKNYAKTLSLRVLYTDVSGKSKYFDVSLREKNLVCGQMVCTADSWRTVKIKKGSLVVVHTMPTNTLFAKVITPGNAINCSVSEELEIYFNSSAIPVGPSSTPRPTTEVVASPTTTGICDSQDYKHVITAYNNEINYCCETPSYEYNHKCNEPNQELVFVTSSNGYTPVGSSRCYENKANAPRVDLYAVCREKPLPTPTKPPEVLPPSDVDVAIVNPAGSGVVASSMAYNRCETTFTGAPYHTGVDLLSKYPNKIIKATVGGEVTYVRNVAWNGAKPSTNDANTNAVPKSYGNMIRILNTKLKKEFIYAHLSTVNVKVGQTVIAEQTIGIQGNTGGVAEHLHLEVRNIDPPDCTNLNNNLMKPGCTSDPTPYLDGASNGCSGTTASSSESFALDVQLQPFDDPEDIYGVYESNGNEIMYAPEAEYIGFIDLNGNSIKDADENPAYGYVPDQSYKKIKDLQQLKFRDTWTAVNWKLVSDIKTAEELLREIGGGGTNQISKYEDGKWDVVSMSREQFFGTNFDLEVNKTYFIKSDYELDFSVLGIKPEANISDMSLRPGWNFTTLDPEAFYAQSFTSYGLLNKCIDQKAGCSLISSYKGKMSDVVIYRDNELFGPDYSLLPNNPYIIKVDGSGGKVKF